MSAHAYAQGLDRTPAIHVPLSPLGFLERSADVFPGRTAIVYGPHRQTWAQTRERCHRLASALVRRGVQRGDTVLVDQECAPLAAAAVARMERPPILVDIPDDQAPPEPAVGVIDYESLLGEGDPSFPGLMPMDEWEPIALNYTSGTTGDPKGVVPSHRAAYLMSLLQLTDWTVPRAPVYLWTLPMFHAITEASGTPVSCAWQGEWDALPAAHRAARQSRQGVRAAALEGLRVADHQTLEAVPMDGVTTGEILLRISSVEVEDVLHRHAQVLHAAVVAKPDEKWGEVPCAFVELKPGIEAMPTEAEIVAFCRQHLAHFKAPRHIVFLDALRKTGTGKIQKFKLREVARSTVAIAAPTGRHGG